MFMLAVSTAKGFTLSEYFQEMCKHFQDVSEKRSNDYPESGINIEMLIKDRKISHWMKYVYRSCASYIMSTRNRSSRRNFSIEKLYLKVFVVFTGKYLCWSIFLVKLHAFRPYCGILKNTYFEKRLQTAASGERSYIGKDFVELNKIKVNTKIVFIFYRYFMK